MTIKEDNQGGRRLLERFRDSMIDLCPESLQEKQAPHFLLLLAYSRLYSAKACELLFSSPQLTSSRKDERILSRSLLYKSTGNFGAPGYMLALQGLMELEFTEYAGPRITGDLDRAHRLWNKHPLPSDPESDPQKVYVVKARTMMNVLEKLLGGMEMFTETYVFPSNGLINYVAFISPEGHPQPIPAKFKEKALYETKRSEKGVGTWLMISPVHSTFEKLSQIRFGGQTGLERVGSMLGFTSVLIFNDVIKVFEDEEGKPAGAALMDCDLHQFTQHTRQAILDKCPHAQLRD